MKRKPKLLESALVGKNIDFIIDTDDDRRPGFGTITSAYIGGPDNKLRVTVQFKGEDSDLMTMDCYATQVHIRPE